MGLFDMGAKIKKTAQSVNNLATNIKENGVNEVTKEALNDIKDNVKISFDNKMESAELAQKMKEEYKQKQKEYKAKFKATQKMGDIEIDDIHKLLKINNCTSNIKKSSGKAKKFAKGMMALYTAGASIAIEHAMKPGDTIFSYNELLDYDLFENDLSIASGGTGRAVVGTAIAGSVGGVLGAMTATRKTKRSVDSMALQISTNNFFFPSVMITYIDKETKTSKKKYTDAYSKAQQTIACMDIIFNQLEQVPTPTEDTVLNETNNITDSNPYEEIKKLKELLDMGIINQEEFDIKKKELLGL